ncbi:MAG: glycoside hydrolase family 3 protein [Streptosporangiales bacterium]|nr:glycoside hydrolase family 3 protein [Streptosporangiales bacterium]
MRSRRIVPTFAVAALLATGVTAPAAHAGNSAKDSRMHGWIKSTIAGMTLKEKVGQLFSTRVYGQTADGPHQGNIDDYGVPTAREVVEKYHLGGVLYFAWADNTSHPTKVAELSNGLQETATSTGAEVPLLASIDQEGGVIVRVGPPATQFPGNMALAAGGSTAASRDAAAITGTELAAMGVRHDFAPVADVNVNPLNPVIGVRSFSEDPQLAAQHTAAQVGGYEGDAGISSAAKHFPGHGDTATDSHYGFPVIEHTRQQWEELDLPPFEAAIDRGIDSIMTAHIQVPALDPSGDPATVSKPILTDILRGELGYDGVIVTDSLDMAGITEKYGNDRAPVLALKAGADVLLNPPEFDVAYDAVIDAVKDGELTEKRIDESVYRVLELKWRNGQIDHPFVDEDAVMDVVGTEQNLARAQEITDSTTTLVKNGGDHLPLSAEPRNVLVTGWGEDTTGALASSLEERDATTQTLETGARPSDESIAAAKAAAETNDVTVVLTMKAWDTDETNPGGNPTDPAGKQQQLVRELVATGKPVVVVGVRDPYDIAYVTEADTHLATYSFNAVAMESLAKVMYGEKAPQGKLPVTIPRADDPDTPLYPFGHGLTW